MTRRLSAELFISTAQAARDIQAFANSFSRNMTSLTAQFNALNRTSNAISRKSFGSAFAPGAGLLGEDNGRRVTTLSNDYVRLADTIKTTSQAMIQLANGQKLVVGETTSYQGNVTQLTAALNAYNEALSTSLSISRAAQAEQDALAASFARTKERLTQRVTSAQTRQETYGETLTAIQAQRSEAAQAVTLATSQVGRATRVEAQARIAYATGQVPESSLIRAGTIRAAAEQRLADVIANEANVVAATERTRRTAQSQFTRATNDENRAIADAATAQRSYTASVSASARRETIAKGQLGLAGLEANVIAARTATPELPKTIRQLQQISPALLQQLEAGGLGIQGIPRQSEAYRARIAEQGAIEGIRLDKDLVRQVTRVSGSFAEFKNNVPTGIISNFSAEIDKNGKVLTRFGSNLSGIGNILNQVSRDFQKVIEWTVATTVVFGSLRYATQELGKITEIDKNLRQLSITANLTRQQTANLFEGLAQVAIETATPLQEVVKAADDIALATRKAGQSTQEWQQNIISLSTSVGILTNLAGIDTVKATDLLVASMKQLEIPANQLPGILNKVTAVAGGQSTAIADVITGLGAMAAASKQANLSIDQTIATVQTLSQTTSKSPEQVATSFKNLVGSLAGPAGIKALAQYNIALKDSAGNVRNILEVYKEISDKIKQGIIPAGDVQALIRGISGGPRRAPDAAALLAAIDDITAAAQRSSAATNEAFVANAKILDTISAKVVQIQARIDKFATSKFGDALREGATALLNVFNALLTILNALPTAFYTGIVQLALLAAGIKFMVSVGSRLVATLEQIIAGLVGIATRAPAAAAGLSEVAVAANATRNTGLVGPNGQSLFIPETPVAGGGLLKYAKAAAPAVAIGAVTGVATAASTGDLGAGLATGLQGAGLTLLLGAPIPHAKALGAALLAVGTAMSLFTGQTQKANDVVAQNGEEVLNSINAYKTAKSDLVGLTQTQADLNKQISDLEGKPKKTEQEVTALSNALQQYGENAVKLVDANATLEDSFNNLTKSLEGFDKYSLLLAKGGALSNEDLAGVVQDLTIEILKRSNPEYKAPSEFTLPGPVNFNQQQQGIPTGISTVPIRPDQVTGYLMGRNPFEGPQAQGFNLEGLKTNAKEVLTLFNEAGTGFTLPDFKPSIQDLNLMRNALLEIKDTIPNDKFKEMLNTLDQIAQENNSLIYIQNLVTQYNAWLSARQAADPLITPQELSDLQNAVTMYGQLASLAANPVDLIGQQNAQAFRSPDAADRYLAAREVNRQRAGALINQALFDKQGNLLPLNTKEQFMQLAEAEQLLSGQAVDVNKQFEIARALANKLGVTIQGLTDDMTNLGRVSPEAAAAVADAFNQAADSILQTYIDKSAELQAAFNAGEFKGKGGQFTAQKEQINSIIAAIGELKKTYADLASYYPELDTTPLSNLAGIGPEIDTFISKISKIPGLQNAASLTTQDLMLKILQLGDTMHLSGKQIVELITHLNNVFKSLRTIEDIKLKFNIPVDVDAKGAIDALQHMRDAIIAAFDASGKKNPAGLAQIRKLDAAISALKAADKTVSSFSIPRGSGPGSSGSTSSGSSGGGGGGNKNDISTLDLPDEIANATNRSALIREAIRRARELQSKIPGATKDARNDIVELLKGTQRILEVRGVKDDYLRKALEELAAIEKKRLDFETKADTIRRIRVGGGDFAAIANVPVNSKTGVSLAGPNGPINVTLNLNGTVLTPAQFAQFANQIAAAIKRQLAG